MQQNNTERTSSQSNTYKTSTQSNTEKTSTQSNTQKSSTQTNTEKTSRRNKSEKTTQRGYTDIPTQRSKSKQKSTTEGKDQIGAKIGGNEMLRWLQSRCFCLYPEYFLFPKSSEKFSQCFVFTYCISFVYILLRLIIFWYGMGTVNVDKSVR